MAEINAIALDPELQMLLKTKESGYNYRERRQEDWRENYTLYRDKVTVNRLTQRQSVNIPLMKQTIRTLLKDVDDMPLIYFENLDNDKQAEVFLNEYWKWTMVENKMELKDIVDKKQDMLFGRTFDQMQIADGMVKFSIEDPEDILVDRFMDPTDLDSARFLVHTHIYKPLSYLEKRTDFDQTKVAELKNWFESDMGLQKASDNESSLTQKNQKMADVGLEDVEEPVLGETIVELTMYFIYHQEEGDEEEQIYLYVEADDQVILMKKPLEEVIGVTKDHYWRTHYPYNTWADDVERQDFWSDGVSDIIRQPNKALNAWFSQLVENRTLKNLNMNLYDSTMEGFVPQTWEPKAWGMYGVPVPDGKRMEDVFQQLKVADLSESLDEMTFVIQMAEKATGATATQQGVQTERQVTLGEVKLALGEAKERVKGISKFYTQAWKDRATKFLKLIEAAPEKLNAVKLFKKGRNTDRIYSREIAPKDWMTESGYQTMIWSQDEKQNKDVQDIEKLNAVRTSIPGNPKLEDVFQRKLLEFAGLKPEEITEILEIERNKRQMMMASPMGAPQAMPGQPMQPMQPQQPPLPVNPPAQ